MSEKRYFVGLRGIACLGVFVHHFFLHFIPTIHTGEVNTSYKLLNNIGLYLRQNPVSVVLNGNFWVFVFMVLSGYAMSVSYNNHKKRGILINIVNRYSKFVVAIIVYVIIDTIIYKLGLYSHLNNNFYIENMEYANLPSYFKSNSWYRILIYVFFDIPFLGNTTIRGAFWTIPYFFVISMMIYYMWYVLNRYNKTIQMVILTVFAIISGLVTFCISAFFIGAILYVLIYEYKVNISYKISFVLLVLGVFLGGFPTEFAPDNVYKFINMIGWDKAYQLYHLLGAFFILLFIYSIEQKSSNISKNKVTQYLDSISFSVYMSHLFIIQQIGYRIGHLIINNEYGIGIATSISFVICCCLIIPFAVLYDKACKLLQCCINKIINTIRVKKV